MVDVIAPPTDDRLSFAGHETFPFRYGWLKKGSDALLADPALFTKDDALVTLGVGKNMVRSIRHWCLATQMVEEESPKFGTRRRLLYRSSIGRSLLCEDGWDPFLEDPASLWLLHWLLVANRRRATTWHVAFTIFNEPTFSKDRLHAFMRRFADAQGGEAVADSTISRDIDCFLRTYVPSRLSQQVLVEDSLDCPLVELDLVQAVHDHQTYRFALGPKSSLPPEVFGFALLSYFAERQGGRRTLSFDECVYGPGSPGQAFKLDSISVATYLDQMPGLTDGGLTFDETAGLRQVYQRKPVDPVSLLTQYYP